jgi:hypothetical protein
MEYLPAVSSLRLRGSGLEFFQWGKSQIQVVEHREKWEAWMDIWRQKELTKESQTPLDIDLIYAFIRKFSFLDISAKTSGERDGVAESFMDR